MFDVRRQLAHHRTDEFDNIGMCSEQGVLSAFDDFQWKTECEKAQEFRNLSPSLCVMRSDGKEFVASIVDVEPLVFYLFVGETQKYKLLGIFPREQKVFVQGIDRSEKDAREALQAFMRFDEPALRRWIPEGWPVS